MLEGARLRSSAHCTLHTITLDKADAAGDGTSNTRVGVLQSLSSWGVAEGKQREGADCKLPSLPSPYPPLPFPSLILPCPPLSFPSLQVSFSFLPCPGAPRVSGGK